nr:hypothetical protein [Tanacetum cinerariifolium]
DDDISVYDDDFEDIEYVEASLSDPEIVSVEEENVVQQEEEVDLEDISQIQDFVLHNFSPEFETFCDHSEETRSGNTTHANYSLLEYDSFRFEPDQERLIYLVKSNIPNDSSNNPLLEEVDLFLFDNSIPPEPPDAETDAGEEIPIVMNDKDKFDEDYHFFMFAKVFSLLFAESEDTIFDPVSFEKAKFGLDKGVFGFWLITIKLSGKAVSELIHGILNLSGTQ